MSASHSLLSLSLLFSVCTCTCSLTERAQLLKNVFKKSTVSLYRSDSMQQNLLRMSAKHLHSTSHTLIPHTLRPPARHTHTPLFPSPPSECRCTRTPRRILMHICCAMLTPQATNLGISQALEIKLNKSGPAHTASSEQSTNCFLFMSNAHYTNFSDLQGLSSTLHDESWIQEMDMKLIKHWCSMTAFLM